MTNSKTITIKNNIANIEIKCEIFINSVYKVTDYDNDVTIFKVNNFKKNIILITVVDKFGKGDETIWLKDSYTVYDNQVRSIRLVGIVESSVLFC